MANRVHAAWWCRAGVAAATLLVSAAAQAAKPDPKPATIAWSTPSFDFGVLDAALGESATYTFTLTNTDGKPANSVTVSLTGDSGFSKIADTCSGKKLTANKSCTVSVRYAPTANGSDSATLSASSSNTALASSSLSGSSAWHTGDLVTRGQSEWDASTAWYTAYNTVYAPTFGLVEVGIPGTGGFSMRFSGPSHVSEYFVQNGTPAALNSDLDDPTGSSSGQYGGEVLSLQLDVDFSAAGQLGGTSGLTFGSLTLCNMSDTSLNGETVSGLLTIANTLLGGGSVGTYAISDFNTIVAELNFAFLNGNPSPFAQAHLQPSACP